MRQLNAPSTPYTGRKRKIEEGKEGDKDRVRETQVEQMEIWNWDNMMEYTANTLYIS